jgi:ABC-2 type transport system permease protein
MAVYKRSYRPYNGPVTERWSRFLVVRRYASEHLFTSKWLTGFFVVSYVPPIIFGILIYLVNSVSLLKSYGMPPPPFSIDGKFFFYYLHFQGFMAFLLTAFVGPGLVAPDLANNALPLYLCRPFSRAEYVLGKIVVLAWLLSLITWIPGLALFVIQWSLAGAAWGPQNWRIAFGIGAGSLIWIAVLSLIAMAMSAWVKWKMAASGLLLGIMFFAAGFAAALNELLETKRGSLLNVVEVIETVWGSLLRVSDVRTDLTPLEAWMTLAGICVFSLFLLHNKIRAREVVKS